MEINIDDIASWGKKPADIPADIPADDRETVVMRSKPKPRSKPRKILDVAVLEQKIHAWKKRRDALGGWMFRHKKFDKSSASLLIELYRELRKEGYE